MNADRSEPAEQVPALSSPRTHAWHRSIAGKLLIAFALIAALTVSATWLSVIRFGQVDTVMHRLTDVNLPAVKFSLGVASAATELVAAANDVGQAENETERFRRMDALSDQIGRLWGALGRLQSVGADPATTARLQELIASIDSIVGGINRTTGEIFTLRERGRRIIDLIGITSQNALHLVQEVAELGDRRLEATMAAGEPGDGASTAALRRLALLRAASELRTGLAAATALFLRFAAAETSDAVTALRQQFDAAQIRVDQQIGALASIPGIGTDRIGELQAAARTLLDMGGGENGLFRLHEQLLRQKAGALIQQRSLQAVEEKLRELIAGLVADAERDALATTTLSASSIANSRLWLIFIAVASLVIAGLIVWKFVLRYVVSRLTDLAHSMRMIAGGDLATPIPAAGRDELGDMSRALVVFRDNAREIRVAKEEADQARIEAEAASRTKSAFLANMSYELRTPLNAIIGYSELLVEDAADRGDTAGAEDLQKIQAAGKHLLGLINGILDLSKIEAGRMDVYLEQVYLAGLVEDVRTIVEPLVKKNGNELVVECPPDIGSMRTDLTKLKQSLINLLSNAAKFTTGGTVRLALSREHRPDGRGDIVFRVSDSGIGMNDEQLGRLFQAFSQADSSTTRNYGGTGLGLTISRHFVVLLGGTIDVTSTPGTGTTFTLQLPDRASQAPAPTAEMISAATGEPEGSALTVLVVDDDPTVHDVLTATLAREGYRLLHARDGAEALEMIRTSPPDIVTLDVMMPKVDGWSVLGMMKSDPDLQHIPVIMVTIVDDRNLGYSLGASEFMTKPIDRARLLALVHRFAGRQSSSLVLIVDDDEEVRNIARATVQGAGLATAEAINGKVALDWLTANPRPALILLDLMMPQMDGFEFLERVGEHDELRDVPVVVLTAKELTESERAFLTQRTVLVLSKGAQPIGSLGAALAAIAGRRPSTRASRASAPQPVAAASR